MQSSQFKELFDEYAPFVWRAMRRLGVAPSDVDDVCQEVFVILYRRLPQFEGRSSLRTWIYSVCGRVALAYRRKRRRQLAELEHELLDGDKGFPSVQATASEDVDFNRALAELDRALDSLDDDFRRHAGEVVAR
jgi:RNA polymerase sigma-70 factor (ECF subfamily)